MNDEVISMNKKKIDDIENINLFLYWIMLVK